MEESPYQPPSAESYAQANVGGDDRDRLRRIAQYQRLVMYAVLAAIAMNIAVVVLQGAGGLVAIAVLLYALATLVFMIYSVFMLGRELHGIGLAIFCSVLMFVPCISLVTLFFLTNSATKILKKHDIPVGFMGANPKDV